ncbi:hypothetical protein LguiA_027078 [Lonicera macranthoides]
MGDPPKSPSPNFYNILGISKSASLYDISKAYKSLVMKWHPDKNSSNKAEAEAKFKSINEAYRVLSSKKREEESFTDIPKTPKSPFKTKQKRNDDFVISNPTLLSRTGTQQFNPASSPRSFSRNGTRRSKTPTPADFYASLARCASNINGTPTNPKECPSTLPKVTSQRCTSTPRERPSLSKVTSQRGGSTPIIFSQSTTARKKPSPIERKLECTLEELCHGCDKKIKITRGVISETGLIVQEEEILKLRVKPGWKKGTKITFEGKGDERPGTLPADIIFIIDEKQHHLFKRLGNDLELRIEIPLVQALTGCTIEVPLLGGNKINLSFDEIIHPGLEKIIPGYGMPISKEEGKRGDLRLKFMVKFPKELSDEQRSDIGSVLDDCS